MNDTIIQVVIVLLLTATATVGFQLSRQPSRAASPLSSQETYIKRLAHVNDATKSASSLRLISPVDPWASSAVLATSFPNTPRLTHAATLLAPRAMLANVFFDQTGPATSACLVDPSSNGMNADSKCVACVQVLPARLRPEALNALGPDFTKTHERKDATVYFVQSVAVLPAFRRQGNGERLMRWAEEAASSAAARAAGPQTTNGSPVELWLAVDEKEAAALALHLRCGYQVEGRAFGNLLLRKEVVAAGNNYVVTAANDGSNTTITITHGDLPKAAAIEATPTETPVVAMGDASMDLPSTAASTFVSTGAVSPQRAVVPLTPRPKPSLGALGRELGAQAVVLGVAALGITALVAPLGGRSVPELLGLGASPSADASGLAFGSGYFASCTALGGGALVGLATETLRRVVVGDLPGSNQGSGGSSSMNRNEAATAALAECLADVALRRQKAITLRVGGANGLGVAPLVSVIIWQLGVALAEEAYYRGFVQSAVQSAVATVPTLVTHAAAAAAESSGGLSSIATSDVVALLFASALFGAAHVPLDDDLEDGVDANALRMEWFLETGAWGLLYGAVFVGAGYNLLAPLGCHTAQNVWWCSEDLQTFAAATDSEVFEMLREEEDDLLESPAL